MATIREYKLSGDFGDILKDMQEKIIGTDKYYSEWIFESWQGLEDLALMYGFDTSGENYPYLMYQTIDTLSEEQREMIFQDERFAPYIELVRERTLPAPQPGQMFYVDGQIQSFSDTNWCDRFAYSVSQCHGCYGWYNADEPFFPFIVEEDDGTTCSVWAPSCAFSDISDDACLIEKWSDDGHPRTNKQNDCCPYFKWD